MTETLRIPNVSKHEPNIGAGLGVDATASAAATGIRAESLRG